MRSLVVSLFLALASALPLSRSRSHALALPQTQTYTHARARTHTQLGQNDEDDRLEPARINSQYFGGAKIAMADAGAFHSTAVTEDGTLFTWGKLNKRVIAEDSDDPDVPPNAEPANTSSLVPLGISAQTLPPVTMVACGVYHTAAVTRTGALYTWGNGQQVA